MVCDIRSVCDCVYNHATGIRMSQWCPACLPLACGPYSKNYHTPSTLILLLPPPIIMALFIGRLSVKVDRNELEKVMRSKGQPHPDAFLLLEACHLSTAYIACSPSLLVDYIFMYCLLCVDRPI